MKILTPENILKTRNKNDGITESILEFTAVDMNKPFIPEKYTQLYHSDIYAQLNNDQKIRYNQLFGLRTNEQFMMFESGFTKKVVTNMLRLKMLNEKQSLVECLNILLEEENRHFLMFKELNKHSMPGIYKKRCYYFLKLSWLERIILSITCRYPQYLISLLWLVLLMEEHAVRFSKDVLTDSPAGGLGELESNFYLVHKLHLKDEAKHVHIDANLIDFVLERSSPAKKNVNVKLLNRLLKATLRPKHAGVNVIKQLVIDCPELESQSYELINEIRKFTYDPCMLPMLENSDHAPVTTALLDMYPEFEHALVM